MYSSIHIFYKHYYVLCMYCNCMTNSITLVRSNSLHIPVGNINILIAGFHTGFCVREGKESIMCYCMLNTFGLIFTKRKRKSGGRISWGLHPPLYKTLDGTICPIVHVHVWSCLVMSGHVTPEVMSCLVWSCLVMSGHVWLCQVMSGLVMSGHVMSGHVWSGHVRSGLVMSGHVWSCPVKSGHVMSCQVTSCHVKSCQVMPCEVRSCHVMSGQVRSCACTCTLYIKK